MKTKARIVMGMLSCMLVATSQAYWTGSGDGSSFSDTGNWSDGVVPFTAGGETATTVNAHTTNSIVNLDAATANTFVDGTQGNFLSTRAQNADRTLTFNADWGDGYNNGGMWLGQNTQGTVNFNHNAGSLTLSGGGTYIGRNSTSTGVVNLNVNGGILGIREVYAGGRSDIHADVTVNLNAGIAYLGQTDATLTTKSRFVTGAYDLGQTTTVAISGSATLVAYDWRGGGVGGGQGTDIFEITGSNATITVDHNFYTRQQGSYLGDTIVKFIADAGGVSTINGFDAAATYRIDALAELVVDLTNYSGTADLLLVDFADGKLSGAYDLANVSFIGGTGDLVQNSSTGDIFLTNIPEPMTIALLGLGGLLIRRRK